MVCDPKKGLRIPLITYDHGVKIVRSSESAGAGGPLIFDGDTARPDLLFATRQRFRTMKPRSKRVVRPLRQLEGCGSSDCI